MIQRQTKTSGNKLQHDFKEDAGYKAWRSRIKSDLNAITKPLNAVVDNNKSGRKNLVSATGTWGKMKETFEEGKP